MEEDNLKQAGLHGIISLVISLVVTYGISMVIPSEDLIWALYAVAFSSFFSAAFTAWEIQDE